MRFLFFEKSSVYCSYYRYMSKLLQKQLKSLPDTPGIYLFHDSKKSLIYVGKATSLKNRVRSYFVGKRDSRPIEQMLDLVKSIKHIQTDSALEAAILESLYIKKYKPKYNILGRDDKSWNYILIGREEYPVISTLRQHEYKLKLDKNDGKKLSEYAYVFGPYPGLNTKAALKLLRRLFSFSTCQKNKRACLYYQMGQCLGVCTKEISSSAYKQKVIKPLVMFLKGNKKMVIKNLQTAMKKSSKSENYEEAGRLRDQIESLTRIHDVAMLNDSFFKDVLQQNDFLVRRVEGYDISNLGASGKVGSMVVFNMSGPVKSQYRKFKIKSVVGQSDVDCLAEVLERRLKHAEWALPQIFLIDGGMPQVNTAKRILKAAGIDIPVVGIAKGAARKKNEIILGRKDKLLIDWIQNNKKLLIQVRDEAHRFAIAYQKKLRKLK